MLHNTGSDYCLARYWWPRCTERRHLDALEQGTRPRDMHSEVPDIPHYGGPPAGTAKVLTLLIEAPCI
jgi:hypothetical protein